MVTGTKSVDGCNCHGCNIDVPHQVTIAKNIQKPYNSKTKPVRYMDRSGGFSPIDESGHVEQVGGRFGSLRSRPRRRDFTGCGSLAAFLTLEIASSNKVRYERNKCHASSNKYLWRLCSVCNRGPICEGDHVPSTNSWFSTSVMISSVAIGFLKATNPNHTAQHRSNEC